MITIVASPKPFRGKTTILQENAIASWLLINPKPRVILAGDVAGIKEIAAKYNLVHISKIRSNRFGTPLVDDVFRILGSYRSRWLAYVNSDIILLKEKLGNVLSLAQKKFNEALLVGKRYEYPVNARVKDNEWVYLTEKAMSEGYLRGPGWIDYFIFNHGYFKRIPAFALGRTFWDKWLVWYGISSGKPVINATGGIVAIHQTHSYNHVPGKAGTVWEGSEARENLHLAGGWHHLNDIDDAPYVYRNGVITHRNNLRPFINYLPRRLLSYAPFALPYIMRWRRWRHGI